MYKTGVVKYNIPDGNNVESTSISSFAGLHLIDNPLLAEENSAADMNNVYLSMENTLTTRPRLEYTGLLVCDKLISQIELAEDDILYHYILNNTIHLRHNGIEIDLGDINIGEEKISAFKKDNEIYILSKNGYFVIKSDNKIYNVVNDVDTYIPIKSIVKNGAETENETLNILNDRYKKLFYWDGISNIESFYERDSKLLKNDYFYKYLENIEIPYNTSHNTSIPNHVRLLGVNKEKDIFILSVYDNNNNSSVYKIENKVLYNLTEKYTLPNNVECSKDCSFLWWAIEQPGDNGVIWKTPGFYILNLESDEKRELLFTKTVYSVWTAHLSSDGTFLIGSVSYEDASSKQYIFAFDVSTNSVKYKETEIERPGIYQWSINSNKLYDLNISLGKTYLREISYYSNNISIKQPVEIPREIGLIYISIDGKSLIGVNSMYGKKSEVLLYNIRDFDITTMSFNKKLYNMRLINESFINDITWQSFYRLDEESRTSNSVYQYSYISDKYSELIVLPEISYNRELIPIVGYGFVESVDVVSNETDSNRSGTIKLNIWKVEASSEPKITMEFIKSDEEKLTNIFLTYHKQFYNNYWFVSGNTLYNTTNNNPTYIAEGSKSVLGDDLDITGMTLLTDSAMVVYKPNKQFVIYASETDGEVYYYKNEMKSNEGNLPKFQTLTTTINQYPLQFNNNGIFVLSIPKNINTDTNTATSISSKINLKYLAEPDKENIITHNHLYWTYVIFPRKNKSSIYVLDNRTNEWYYWEVPIKILGCREIKRIYDVVKDSSGETIRICNDAEDWSFSITELLPDGTPGYVTNYSKNNRSDYEQRQYVETEFITEDGIKYEFKTIDHFDSETGMGTEYLDLICTESNGTKAIVEGVTIPWKWESQIMPLSFTKYSKGYPAIGYTKQLQQTGFIFVDSDKTEEYALDYQFTVYGKHMTDKTPKSLPMGTLNYIRSVLKRTRIPKFNFIKITLSNHEDNNNKLNLISLKFKYRLMQEVV